MISSSVHLQFIVRPSHSEKKREIPPSCVPLRTNSPRFSNMADKFPPGQIPPGSVPEQTNSPWTNSRSGILCGGNSSVREFVRRNPLILWGGFCPGGICLLARQFIISSAHHSFSVVKHFGLSDTYFWVGAQVIKCEFARTLFTGAFQIHGA